jgi:hypothetical protein
LSAKFKGKFTASLRRENLKFFRKALAPEDPVRFGAFVNDLRKKDWVVYCKPPFGAARHVVNYLGRYTHRAAISNNRLIACEDGKVSFKYRDYAAANAEKVMTLSAVEFLRRLRIARPAERFSENPKLRTFSASRQKGQNRAL